MNDHLPEDTLIKLIKHGETAKFNVILDRLSICFNDPDPERVKKTCGLLIDDHMSKFVSGMTVTAN